MDDSIKLTQNNDSLKTSLGMDAFGPSERAQFGQNVRLAMACIDSPPKPSKGSALPKDESSIRHRLKALSQEITSNHADLLELLVRFDDLQGWKSSGSSHCAAWMNFEIGISIQLSWEYLRVGRKLQSLPTVKALFRVGKLSWSKVRLITRVADDNNEKILCHAALDASVSDVKRICEGYNWIQDDNGVAENERAIQQWSSRSLTWNEASNGSTKIQLVLPPELAQAFLNSVEQSLNQLSTSNNAPDTSLSQSRADAAVLMAEASLQNAGRAIATADRYQVSISVDANALATTKSPIPTANSTNTPTKRPTLNGVGPVAIETARRIACDCSLSINEQNKENQSEPTNIGRKSRIWPNAMARAIKERDQHCAWPGCTHARHLHIHHIKHWADGGETSVHNGVCLCSYHHTLVHEGGYTIEHVEANTAQFSEQFIQQQHNNDFNMFDFESALRNDRESFNTVRNLSTTRYRYRILDAQGKVFSGRSSDDRLHGCQIAANQPVNQQSNRFRPSPISNPIDSTRVESVKDSGFVGCREAIPDGYYRSIHLDKQISQASHQYE